VTTGDQIRRLVGDPTAHVVSRTQETPLERCDDCRGMVPFTDLRHVESWDLLICGECTASFAHWRALLRGEA
jgi:hypothetical protein